MEIVSQWPKLPERVLLLTQQMTNSQASLDALDGLSKNNANWGNFGAAKKIDWCTYYPVEEGFVRLYDSMTCMLCMFKTAAIKV